ncbi:MAG: hypothetical protein E7053_08010 [Lentisphaerae bacterium]|nr:hypothetical protein [Lentisphaerota bacterium]
MGSLKDVLEVSRGKFRAFCNENDLGELALPPEIKAGYRAENFVIHDLVLPSRTLEGNAEIHAQITLKLKCLPRALAMLDAPPAENMVLKLQNDSGNPPLTLIFPACKLLPVWEFAPGFTGEHLITLKFSAVCDPQGKLFYYNCT